MRILQSLQLAYEFVIFIVVGISVGYVLYQRYDNSLFVVIGFLLGVFLAFLNVFKLIRRKTLK